MQRCASAARLLGGRPILLLGIEATYPRGSLPPRIILAFIPLQNVDQRQTCIELRTLFSIKVRSCRRTQDGTGRDFADRGVAPQGDQSLRAQAMIMALRNPGLAPAVSARYHRAGDVQCGSRDPWLRYGCGSHRTA